MCGFIAQLVEHRTGIAEVTGSNPVEALIFFRLLLSNCLSWKINCDDHPSLSSTTAVQIWIISYILHKHDTFHKHGSFFLVLMLMLMSLVLCLSHKCEPGLRQAFNHTRLPKKKTFKVTKLTSCISFWMIQAVAGSSAVFNIALEREGKKEKRSYNNTGYPYLVRHPSKYKLNPAEQGFLKTFLSIVTLRWTFFLNF